MRTFYQRWEDGEYPNSGSFTTQLMLLYRIADHGNRAKLNEAFPEYFNQQIPEETQETEPEEKYYKNVATYNERHASCHDADHDEDDENFGPDYDDEDDDEDEWP